MVRQTHVNSHFRYATYPKLEAYVLGLCKGTSHTNMVRFGTAPPFLGKFTLTINDLQYRGGYISANHKNHFFE